MRKTIIFVTHDIDEAVKLGDRIAILRQGGVLEQYDTPAEVLGNPASDFVADFVGADRALKRLNVTGIEIAELEKPPVVALDAPLAEARRAMDADRAPWAIVLDAAGDLHGYLSRARADGDGRVADRAQRMEAWVSTDATLKDAAVGDAPARRGMGRRARGGRFLGVLTPESLHAAMRHSMGTGVDEV